MTPICERYSRLDAHNLQFCWPNTNPRAASCLSSLFYRGSPTTIHVFVHSPPPPFPLLLSLQTSLFFCLPDGPPPLRRLTCESECCWTKFVHMDLT
ncbi:unnamed protein product [Chondrus crispus]|uniref:Uncharacterized protein n=1 Tax=Chondrus crispus TaxID=2769 RepID=R7QN70_CHOCR|nr:unnamed protein product [Chondrus crispus]CDF38921.1 unnamed protein product [Chondrus crispus]|eukprot:XP_005718826.1 unnamed protein product [Chondrus crispus]